MANPPVPFEFQGQPVTFDAQVWMNATQAAKPFGKRPTKWLELPTTQRYLSALRKALAKQSGTDVQESDIALYRTFKGHGQEQGTWMHPKLAVAFARWINDDFAVWCDLQLDAIVRAGSLMAQIEQAQRHAAKLDEIASAGARSLSAGRVARAEAHRQVKALGDELQMGLTLDGEVIR